MKKVFYLLVLLIGTLGNLSAQMVMFKGTFDEALQKAKEEKKDLFVDFYADWCGPCKVMEKEVFSQPEVGAYFNAHFICVQVNVDTKENREVTKMYKVEALPTMLMVSREGKELRRVKGVVPPATLIREAKVARGEELSFEQLYEKYKKKKKDTDIQQQLLLEAPAFIPTQQGYDQQKWGTRIESIFPNYLKSKKLEHMINEKDLTILTLYHPMTSKNDPIFDFVAANFDKYAKAVGREKVAPYLMMMNNAYIIQLCQKGDLAYKERLGRVNEDLKEVYSGFSFGELSTLDAVTLLADATYSLYKRDEAKFFENMDKYLVGKGDQVTFEDYAQPLEDLFIVYEGKLSQPAYSKCIVWIKSALGMDIDAEARTRLLIMMGQCFSNTGNKSEAKVCYNQAFVASAEVEDKAAMKELQQVIQQSLQGL